MMGMVLSVTAVQISLYQNDESPSVSQPRRKIVIFSAPQTGFSAICRIVRSHSFWNIRLIGRALGLQLPRFR